MAKSKNANLHGAKAAKNDEFFTQLADIEKELKHYTDQFRGKVVFCNCDDPANFYNSDFFNDQNLFNSIDYKGSEFLRYFVNNFTFLGLKKLIATHFQPDGQSYVLEVRGDKNNDGKIDGRDIVKTPLKGNGDFRSPECVKLLKKADIVVTNPPFSLFREYVAQLIEYDKKFLIIGNKNALTYKEIFKLIKDNQMWIGYSQPSEFGLADGTITKQMQGLCRWFTNLNVSKRNEKLILYKTYKGHEYEYPKYDNYDAIEVGKVSDIPIDYDGVMGVPITFLDKYNPSQFDIVKFRKGDDDKDLTYTANPQKATHTHTHTHTHKESCREECSHTSEYSFVIVGQTGVDVTLEKGRPYINGKRMYSRLFIKRV